MAKRKISVDMTGVEAFTRCPEGQWLAKVKKVELGEVQGSGDDALKAQFEVIEGSAKGNTVFETFSLTEKALWKLKSFLMAIGNKADGKMTLDLDKLEGKICGIDVIHDEYQGTKRAKISTYLKPQDLQDSESDEDDEDEDDEEEEEEEVKPSKKKAAPAKKAPPKKAKKPEPEDDDEDEDEDEDEDDEPPAKKKPAKKAPAKKVSKKKPEPEDDDDEDDDDDWEDDDD